MNHHRLPLIAPLAALLTLGAAAVAAEHRVASPDGTIAVTVSDAGGLRYAVTLDGKPVLTPSQLGLVFAGGLEFGPASKITGAARASHDGTWTNPFGKRREVPDRWNELRLTVAEPGERTFALVVRAFNDGIALRYDLPEASKLGAFRLEAERTEFAFAADHRCWVGNFSHYAECHYPEQKLSAVKGPAVLPLLAELPHGYAAIAESDLLDWAGMFLGPVTGTPAVRVHLAPRKDKQGAVKASVPIVSPWRVVMLGRKPGDLVESDLIATLATPNRIGDPSWIKPGITAWDPWWAKSSGTRGTTATDKPYIDLASRMGWPYMLVDWGWTKDKDATRWNENVNLPELFVYAKERNVRLLLWLHSNELDLTGDAKAFANAAAWGAAGVKVDFMNSDSQEAVQWYVKTLAEAAKHRLIVDFHGAYKPTGLARTFPNYLTQEGVLGNEYYKFPLEKVSPAVTPAHNLILAFTRGLLGPMDYTPGGFQNRTRAEWVMDAGAKPDGNCQVLGTRAHQLALTMIYNSPLLCLCDSPTSYLGKDLQSPEPGLEFYRDLPTVWDETRVLDAKVGEHIVMARRSGNRWYLGAMNADTACTLTVPLAFLGKGTWSLRSFADGPDSAAKPMTVVETTREVRAGEKLTLTLAAGGGGFAGVLTPAAK